MSPTHDDPRDIPSPTRPTRRRAALPLVLAFAGLAAGVSIPVAAAPAAAAPTLLTAAQVGAQKAPQLAFADAKPTGTLHVFPSSSPGATPIADAMRVAQPGQAVVVHGGEYREHLVTPAKQRGTGDTRPIWLVEAPGEHATLLGSASDTAVFLRITQPYWVVRGLEIDASGAPVHAVRVERTHSVLIDGIEAHSGTSGAGVMFHHAADSAIVNSSVHDFVKPDDNDSHGVLVYGSSQRILVRGNDSWGNSGDSVQCAPEGETGRGSVHPVDVTIDGNRFGNRDRSGGLRAPDRENAVDIKTCSGVTVRLNKMMGYRESSTSPQGAAIVVHYDADRVLIEHNRIWDANLGASLGSELNTGLGAIVFRRNLVFGLVPSSEHSAGGLRVAPARVAEIYNNTFYDIGVSTGQPGYALSVAYEAPIGRAAVFNNIIDGADRGVQLGTVSDLTLSHNLFWRTASGIPAGSLVADPMWRHDPLNNDFYTRDGSPARDAGLPTAVPYCGAGPDIGFLETCTPDAPGTAVVDLAAYVAGFAARVPGAASEGYRTPSHVDAYAWTQAVAAARRGDVGAAAYLLATVDYDLHRLQDRVTGRTVLALRERPFPDGSYAHAWGLYLVRPSATKPLLVEVPHPRSERAVEDLGVAAYRATDATALLVAGAHRKANADGSADVAHQKGSGFHLAHLALTSANSKVLQVHGFAASLHPGYGEAVISAGTAAPTPDARAVNDRLRSAGFSTCLYAGGTACSQLAGTRNVQGTATRATGASFVHLEVSDGVRADTTRRRLAGQQAGAALG